MPRAENLRMLMFALQQDLNNEFLKRLVRRLIVDVPGFQGEAFVRDLQDYADTLEQGLGSTSSSLPTKALACEMWLEKIELVQMAMAENGSDDGDEDRSTD
ncbi:hypothetical protein JYU29_12880 [Tianweitania sp. BSSL-BM11]|uniref:Uncharacterized protein n=1 Tax=Tianweitania aestuarii TaxID=2814886 RepID=A0ABS5RWZ0_9HYPH|nr:hypothetical protein [Tianweitania aestuarii]MBS9721578.1 hypothetical protein [Tianweitania aestuarii]